MERCDICDQLAFCEDNICDECEIMLAIDVAIEFDYNIEHLA